jgi:hypothetical protein
LRSQNAISKPHRGGRRWLPYVFTEHGAVMAANVLNSATAVKASIEVVRTFIRLREVLATHSELARKLALLERTYDAQFKAVFDAIKALMTPAVSTKRRIGFTKSLRDV